MQRDTVGIISTLVIELIDIHLFKTSPPKKLPGLSVLSW